MSGARPDPEGQSAGGTRRAVAFVAIAYALAWLVCLPLWLRGAGLTQPLTTILGVIMMLTPTAAALIVHRATGGRRLTDVLGLRLGLWRRWLPYALLAWLGPVVLAFLAVALAAALGVFRTDLTNFSGYAAVIKAVAGELPPIPLGGLVALSLVQILIGAVINTVPALGEEIGWRGYLYDCLADRPVWFRVGITGVAWGLWHAPLILLGYNYPTLSPALALLFMVVFTTLLSALFDWLRSGAGNVYVSALAHGAVNASAGVAVLFSLAGAPPDTATTGLLGWTGWVVLAAAVAVTVVLRRRRSRRIFG